MASNPNLKSKFYSEKKVPCYKALVTPEVHKNIEESVDVSTDLVKPPQMLEARFVTPVKRK